MANEKKDTMEMRVKKLLAKEKMISNAIARERIGVPTGYLRSLIFRLRKEGWDIERDPSIGAYRLVSMPGNPFLVRSITYRTYTPAEFRSILTTLYGAMWDWELAAFAMEDFNASHITVYRWLTRGKPITGPAVALADKLIAEHNAKMKREP